MIRNIDQSLTSSHISTNIVEVSPIYIMVNNFFSNLKSYISNLRNVFPDREITLSTHEIIEGNIHWNLKMVWCDVNGRRHDKVINGLFEIPPTTKSSPMMEFQYRHYITDLTNVRDMVEFEEMWYNTITYVRVLEFIREIDNYMKSVQLDRVIA
jgi:hypothetical protein